MGKAAAQLLLKQLDKKEKSAETVIRFPEKGCETEGTSQKGFAEAVQAANNSELVSLTRTA